MIAVSALLAPAVLADADAPESAPLSIGLALGSGGAGGLAHIAMLQVFDELGVKPAQIAGTSVGAVIGALYAAGLSAGEIRDIFHEFAGSELDVLSKLMEPSSDLRLFELLSPGIDDGGVLDARGFMDFLAGKIEARSFDDLAIPLAVVATDFRTGESVVLDSGDLLSAIRASMAVPGLFPPVDRGAKLLIDGGTSNPLPYDVLADHHDLIIAIDVSGSRSTDEARKPSITDLLFSSFEIMQQSIIASRMRAGGPDIYIETDSDGVRLLHFNRIEAVLEQAEPAADALRTQLCEQIGSAATQR